MRIVKSAVLYTALALVANVAIAGSALEELRDGDMMKLAIHQEPMAVSSEPLPAPKARRPSRIFRAKFFW